MKKYPESFFFLILSLLRISPLFSPDAKKSGKNADQNNSKYGHFFRSAAVLEYLKLYNIEVVIYYYLER